MKRFLITACLLITTTTPSFAQLDNEEAGGRIEKLEHDIMLLQRQISRSSGSVSSGNSGGAVGSADFEVRLSAIEEQMRKLSGKTEENEFQARKLSENLEKLQKDTDFRFNELAKTPAVAAEKPTDKTTDKTADKPADKSGKSVGKTVDTADESAPSPSADIEHEFANAREHYNYAFRLLNQTQYDKAAASFEEFTKKYPDDALIGNAYYWQGETFYIRRDFVKAADSFRQGFEALPSGPKAPDNLLKLAMTLDALKRDKEACVVLGQVVSKFKKSAAAVTQKAEQERKRIACE